MTSMQRVLTSLGHRAPDRVPLFLLCTMHGAKELRCSVKDYFSRADAVVEGQLALRAKYHGDCYYPFFYAALETEAMGGEVRYVDDGPANAGAPLFGSVDEIARFKWPDPSTSPVLARVLEAVRALKAQARDDVPIIGVVMSPFSLPVMQLGLERYLQLVLERPDLFEKLMAGNEDFCVGWANAQLAAGATAICYFDPMSSTTVFPLEVTRRTGIAVARRTIARIKGPTATHLASSRALPLIDDLATTGTAVVGVGPLEDLAALKARARGRLTLLGNLNGVEMRRWTPQEAEEHVRGAIGAAAAGGGFILSDGHGEIPFQVADQTLAAIGEAVDRWGRFPLASTPS